jgi:hypothetical protein
MSWLPIRTPFPVASGQSAVTEVFGSENAASIVVGGCHLRRNDDAEDRRRMSLRGGALPQSG